VEPLGKGGEVPEFTEVDAEFEEAVFMEGQAAALVVDGDRFADGFDGQVVGGDGGDAAVGDPLQEGRVQAVEFGAGIFDGGIGLAVAVHDQFVEDGLEAEDLPEAIHNKKHNARIF
jgi:hypothetical protein